MAFNPEDYPEHAKLNAVADKSQAIGEFIEHAGFILCEPTGRELIPYAPVGKSINELLADYFEIDLKVIEKEKRAMLDLIREGQ